MTRVKVKPEDISLSSTFRLTFQNESWYVSLEWYFIYLLFLSSVHGFMHETSDFLLYINIFIYQVLCTLIYRRRNLYSFLSYADVHPKHTQM